MRDSPPINYVNSAPPEQLAEGTRRDVSVQRAKGMSVATRCDDVDHFITTFHRFVEDSTIFIPNARREVGTVLPFSFDLTNDQSVLVGIGSVLEELTTANNRFGRVGIVLSIQKLKRESIPVMERMRAARKAYVEQHTPAPVFARAMTAPIAIDEVLKARSTRTFDVQVPKKPLEVTIPSPVAKAEAPKPEVKPEPNLAKPEPKQVKPEPKQARAKTVLGIPAIGKMPAKQPVMQIPTIPLRDLPKRPTFVPEATPLPHAAVEAVPESLGDVPHDTVRDEFPFALRHELRMLEQRAQPAAPAVPAVVDDGWDSTPLAVPEPVVQAPVVVQPVAVAPEPEAPAPVVAAPVVAAVPETVVEQHNLELTPGASALAALQALCEQTPSLAALAALGGAEAILGPIPTSAPEQGEPAAFEAMPAPEEIYESAASRAPTVAEETIQEPVDDGEPPPIDEHENVVAETRYSTPIDIPVEASDALTVPKGPLSYQTPIVAPPTSWRRPLRWVAQIAIMVTVFVSTAAIVASIDVPNVDVVAPPAPESASAIEQPAAMPERTVPTMPMMVEQEPTPIAEPPVEAARSQPVVPVQRAAPEPVRRPVASPPKQVKRPRTARKCTDLDCL